MALGHKLGAIRASITFIGIIVAELLAAPLGSLIRPLFPHLGVHNPIWQWVLPPFVMFVVVLAIFKSVEQMVHHKVYVRYKHYTDEAQMLWWERMNHRVGLCVGTLNALAYLVIICSVINLFSYWTVQFMVPPQGAPSNEILATATPPADEQFSIKLLDSFGRGLKATGMDRVARAVNPLPVTPMYFKLADFAGLIYQNPQLAGRLADYPPFIGISQRDDFQNIGKDADFHNAWQNHSKIGDLLGNDHARAIWMNKDVSAMIMDAVSTNLDDLESYLPAGTSQKFDDPILGRWHFNVVSTIAMMSESRPNFSSKDMIALRAIWTPAYAKTVFLASSDGKAFMNGYPHFKAEQQGTQPQFDLTSYSGQWNGTGVYEVSLANSTDNKSGTGRVSGARLTLKLNNDTLIFDR